MLQQVVQQNPNAPVRIEIAAFYRSGFFTKLQPVWNLGNKSEVQRDGVTAVPPVSKAEDPFRSFSESVNVVSQVFAEDEPFRADRRFGGSLIVDAILCISRNLRSAVDQQSKLNAVSALMFILEKATDEIA